jgi:hypothetical protein
MSVSLLILCASSVLTFQMSYLPPAGFFAEYAQ